MAVISCGNEITLEIKDGEIHIRNIVCKYKVKVKSTIKNEK